MVAKIRFLNERTQINPQSFYPSQLDPKTQYHPQYERHIQIYDYATPYVVLSDVLIELYVNDLTKNSPHKSNATLSPDQRYQDIDMLLLEKAYQTESQRWNQYLFRQFF